MIKLAYNRYIITFILNFILGANISYATSIPKYDDFSIKSFYHGPSKQPDFSKEIDREFIEDRIKNGLFDLSSMKKGPNFAGNYYIARMPCGGPCISYVIINNKSGKHFWFPNVGDNYPGLSLLYRKNSRLIISTYEGVSNLRPHCIVDWYNFNRGKFHKILSKDLGYYYTDKKDNNGYYPGVTVSKRCSKYLPPEENGVLGRDWSTLR